MFHLNPELPQQQNVKKVPVSIFPCSGHVFHCCSWII